MARIYRQTYSQPLKIAMDLARHSDINLTLAFYSHTSISDRAKSLAKLPNLALDETPTVV